MSDPSRAFSSEQGSSTVSRLSARTQTHADISQVELAEQSTYHLTVEDATQIYTVMANKTHSCFRNQLKMQIWALCSLTVRFHSWAHWIFSLSQGFQGEGGDETEVRIFLYTLKLDRIFFIFQSLRCLRQYILLLVHPRFMKHDVCCIIAYAEPWIGAAQIDIKSLLIRLCDIDIVSVIADGIITASFLCRQIQYKSVLAVCTKYWYYTLLPEHFL